MPRKNAFSLFANLSQFQMRSHIDRVNPAEVPIRDPDLTTPSLTGINCLALNDWLPMVGSPGISGKIRHFLDGSGCRCVLHSHLRAPTCQPVKPPYTVEICCSPSAFNDARAGAFPDPVGRCRRTSPVAGWQSDLQTTPESATPRRQIISMRGAGQNSRGTSDRTQSDPELPGVPRTATNPFAPLPTRVTRPRPPRLQAACRRADNINFHPQRCDTQRQSKTSRAPRTTHHRYRQICTPAPAVTANKELTPGRPLPPPRTAHHRNPVLCPLRSPAREGIGRSPRRDHAADPDFRKKTELADPCHSREKPGHTFVRPCVQMCRTRAFFVVFTQFFRWSVAVLPNSALVYFQAT